MDTSWVKTELNKLFSCGNDINFADLCKTRLARFNGKLYKYCSFSEGDSNHSLSNLKNGIIYFSKPENFNDPFDCALGFSINETINAVLPQIIDENVKSDGENGNLSKDFIKIILSDNPSDIFSDKPLLKDLDTILSSSEMVEILQECKDIKDLQSDKFKEKLIQSICKSSTFPAFLNLYNNYKSDNDIYKNNQGDIARLFLITILKNPTLIKSLGNNTTELESNIKLLSNIFNEESTVNKLEQISTLSGYNGRNISQQIEMLNNRIKPVTNKLKEIINDKFAITCFSESPDNILMWSHYANKHTGFCVEYDFSKLKFTNMILSLYPVIYSKNRANIPISLFDIQDLKNPKIANNVDGISDLMIALLTKSDIWNYENEWRIIASQAELNDQKLHADIATKIYYGANISDENRAVLSKICQDKNIETVQYTLDVDKFKLIIK
jgi:hypothetical protein